MAENENGEEKKYPAMAGHLRKLRDRGEYAHSRDFPRTMVLAMIVVYLLTSYRSISDKLKAILSIDIFNPMFSFGDHAVHSIGAITSLSVQILAPIFIIILVGLFVTTLVEGGGIMLSFGRIAPDFTKLNPMTGLKNIFTLNSLTEALKGVLKASTVIIVLGGFMLYEMNALFWSPTCDFECVQGESLHIFATCLILGTLIIFVFGVIDIPISRLLFSHQNMMTLTEMKQELKESFGNPVIRQRRTQLMREGAMMERASFDRASMLLYGDDAAIAIRFIRGTTPTPLIMAKARERVALDLRMEAARRRMPMIKDNELATAMVKKSGIGEPIGPQFYDDVARVLIQAGLLG